MRPLAVLQPLILPGLLAGCFSIELDGPRVQGSGTPATEERSPGAFDRIEIQDEYEVEVVVGGAAHRVTLAGDDNLLPLVETRIRDGELVVMSESDLRATDAIRIRIETPSLAGLGSSGSSNVVARGIRSERFAASVSGSSRMRVEGDAFGDLVASVSGSGTIAMRGTARAVDASVSGSGALDLLGVPAAEARVEVSGSGDVAVRAANALDATVSGSGDVVYEGSPRVTTKISGSGSVRPAG